MPLPQRKRPVHLPLVERPNQSAIVLLSVCTDQRRPLLTRPEAVKQLLGAWTRANAWIVGRYVILPDHLHMFCAPASQESVELGKWVKYWKTLVSRDWPWPNEQPIWQQSFWDQQLRNGENYGARWEYVRNNPVRHDLVATSKDWPWQGEMVEFRFHDPA